MEEGMATSPTAERPNPNPAFGAPHVFILALVNGEEPLRVHRIVQANTLVGREGDADFMINDDEVSARHVMIRVDGPVCMLTELGSCNGTLVNGRPVREAVGQRLRHLDEIQVGGTRILVLQGRSREQPKRI
jgi:pSer/pThr/pTyr-binding forkhead associated (FHA) protein